VKKIKPGIIVTLVLAAVVIIIGVSIGRTILENRQPPAPAAPRGAGAQGQTGGAPPAQAGAQGPAQAGGGAQGQRQQAGAGTRAATAVRVTPVVRDTIENSIMVNGDVLAVNQVDIFPTVAGRVTETHFQIGDAVSQGTVVATVDPSRPGQVFSESPVIATISGTVVSAPVRRGDTVSTQTAVYVVGDLTNLVIETFVPERFSNAIRQGLPAQVFLAALPGESFAATVAEISPVLDPVSRTLRIRLRFTGRMDPRIKANMFASVSLVTHSRQNVPVIPRTAVINTYGSWIVFVVDEQNIASRREVLLGIENESFVEVIGGLEPGEMVVIAGQNFLTHGDLVRIVE